MWQNLTKMTKYGEICRWNSEMWRNLAEYQRNLAKYGEPPARFGGKCKLLTESGRKQRNLAKRGEIWRNISKIKKLRNVAKFRKNDKIK